MTFDALCRVAETMPVADIELLISAQYDKPSYPQLVRDAQDFFCNADPVADFKRMMIADMIG